jgi:hypothetical protein
MEFQNSAPQVDRTHGQCRKNLKAAQAFTLGLATASRVMKMLRRNFLRGAVKVQNQSAKI